jgi:probable DNA metabolism protein
MNPPRPDDATLTVRLDSDDDAAGFRDAARRLLRAGIEPERVRWTVAGAAIDDLFGGCDGDDDDGDGVGDGSRDGDGGGGGTQEDAQRDESAARALALPTETDAGPRIALPAALVHVIDHAALHADRDRHALLYRLAWRLVHEPTLRHDPLDPDRLRAEQMARAVRREMHKMTAFVRFRPMAEPVDADRAARAAVGAEPGAEPGAAMPRLSRIRHVAWFEPEHHVVEATAPFFARRFAQMDWAILTPGRCVRWDGRELQFGPGARRDEAPGADAAERLWLTYYESIFNPARLKLAMMRKEMPRRYWKNLPEAVLIEPLARRATERSGQMVAQGGSLPARRRGAASLAMRQMPQAAEAPALLSLKDIGAAAERCRRCPIGAHATQAVPGAGPANARLMIVGEQPGDQEDLRGQPFVGPAGRLLDRAFARLGWARETLYLTNAVKHVKHELRGRRRLHKTPAQQEAAACLHWLESEIALVEPAAVVALGATAARSLLGRAVAVNSERGWHRRADGLPVLVTLHPAALLRMDDPAAAAAGFEQWVADLALAAPHRSAA